MLTQQTSVMHTMVMVMIRLGVWTVSSSNMVKNVKLFVVEVLSTGYGINIKILKLSAHGCEQYINPTYSE